MKNRPRKEKVRKREPALAQVERHPQKRQIMELFLQGYTHKQIAKGPPFAPITLDPPVSNYTLFYFKKKLEATDLPELTAVSARNMVRNRLNSRARRREMWIAAAEKKLMIKKNGEAIIDPGTGLPRTTMDHKALIGHDANERADIDVLCRMENLYQDTAQTTVQIAILTQSEPINEKPPVRIEDLRG